MHQYAFLDKAAGLMVIPWFIARVAIPIMLAGSGHGDNMPAQPVASRRARGRFLDPALIGARISLLVLLLIACAWIGTSFINISALF